MTTTTTTTTQAFNLKGRMVVGEEIRPDELDNMHLLNMGMRRVSKYWFLAFSRLMAMRRWQWVDWTPYGATDGLTLYLNPEGLRKMAQHKDAIGLMAFLLVHESLHAMLGHGWRLAHLRYRKLANIAADYIINNAIADRNEFLRKEKRVPITAFPIIEGALLKPDLADSISATELYRILLKDYEDEQEPEGPEGQPGQPAPEDGDEDGESNDIDANPDTDGDEDGDPGDEDGDPGEGSDQPGEDGEDGDEDGAGSGDEDGEGEEPGQPGDGTSGDEGDEDGEPGGGSGNGEGDEGDEGGLSGFPGTGADDLREPEPEEGETPEDAREEVEEASERVLIQDHVDSKARGTGSDSATRFTNHRERESVVDWRDLLREWMEARVDDGWDRPFNAPVFTSTGLVSAGRLSRKLPPIVAAVDLSGSVGTRTVEQFLREVEEITEDVQPAETHLLGFCDGITDERFAGDTALEPGDQFPDRLQGCGGTSFHPIFEWVEDNNVEPAFVLMLTDGEAPFPEDPGYPVLWLSSRLGPEGYPFGDVIMLPADAQRY